jgi:hypothetical protein
LGGHDGKAFYTEEANGARGKESGNLPPVAESTEKSRRKGMRKKEDFSTAEDRKDYGETKKKKAPGTSGA